VAVRLPPFWAKRPAVWFAQAEAQFFLTGVSSETTKFFRVISQLDHRYAVEVEDIITSPPERDSYTKLRNELVQRLSPSREQRIRQLLTFEEIGDRKPSQLLRHLRGLAPDVPEDFLRNIWSSRLPPNIQATLAGQQECSLDAAASCADRISEVVPQPALAEDRRPLPPGGDNQRRAGPSSHQLQGPPLSSRDPGSSTRRPDPGPRNSRTNSRSPSRGDTAPTLCWYHRRFGARAQKCTPPCAYHQQGN
jgi:hypothetical protein